MLAFADVRFAVTFALFALKLPVTLAVNTVNVALIFA